MTEIYFTIFWSHLIPLFIIFCSPMQSSSAHSLTLTPSLTHPLTHSPTLQNSSVHSWQPIWLISSSTLTHAVPQIRSSEWGSEWRAAPPHTVPSRDAHFRVRHHSLTHPLTHSLFASQHHPAPPYSPWSNQCCTTALPYQWYHHYHTHPLTHWLAPLQINPIKTNG